MQKSQEERETFMELTPQILIVVLPLIFLGGFVDSVAGGGGLITLPAYLMAGIPAHLAMGTNKVVNGTGTALASFKYFRGGKVLLRPAIVSGIGALLGRMGRGASVVQADGSTRRICGSTTVRPARAARMAHPSSVGDVLIMR